MHFGLALNSWNIDLWDIDVLGTDLDLLIDHSLIQISPVNILFVSETSWRHLQDMSCRSFQDVLKIRKCLLGYIYIKKNWIHKTQSVWKGLLKILRHTFPHLT